MKGKVLILGEVNIEGNDLTGVFVECTVEELKKGRHLFGEEVEIATPKEER